MADIVERLPFKLARPNPNTGVTDASEIDYENSDVKAALDEVKSTIKEEDSVEWVEAHTDAENKITYGVKEDGNFYVGGKAVTPKLTIEDMDGETGSESQFCDSAQYLRALLDSEDKVIVGVKQNGKFFAPAGIEGIQEQVEECVDEAFENKDTLDKFEELGGSLYWNGAPIGDSSASTDIVALNDPVYTVKELQNMKRPSRSGSTVQFTPFVLLHASDVHGDGDTFARIVEYYDYYTDYIDDAIVSGDMVSSYYEDDIAYYRNTQGAKKIMLAVGNHDTAKKVDGSTVWDYHVGQDSYNKFIKDFYSEWGNVTITQNKCYYYKDYTAYNIRLIVTDCMEGASNDQQTWFESALANTPSGYSVLCVCHFPHHPKLTDTNASPHIECSFNSRQNAYLNVNNDNIPSAFITAVDNWLTANNNANMGRFICWIGGHTHNDYVCIAKNTTQLVITVDTAAHTSRNVSYSDMQRVENTKSMDLFNVMAVDTYQKIIKVMRVGADVDSWMRSKKTMCIQYASNEAYSLTNNIPELIYCS